jgi:hypothetical protein
MNFSHFMSSWKIINGGFLNVFRNRPLRPALSGATENNQAPGAMSGSDCRQSQQGFLGKTE